jgi:hypothetical protein
MIALPHAKDAGRAAMVVIPLPAPLVDALGCAAEQYFT